MKKTSNNLGPSLLALTQSVPPRIFLDVLDAVDEGEKRQLVAVPEPDEGEVVFRARALVQLGGLSREALLPIENRCIRLRDLADGKGPTSLEMVAAKRLSNSQKAVFDQQADDLCKCCWMYVNDRRAFDDAESFNDLRRYRENGKMYNVCEVDLETAVSIDAGTIPVETLAERITEVLDTGVPCTISTLDLPATATHPVSVLVVIRHGGRLSSVAAHQNDGAKRQIYFRPSHEATLIYTPSTRVIEVCSQAHLVRQQVADTFATEVLGHNVSAKPLDWKSYDLTRFRKSFILDLPELGMAAITAARVIEADSRLSNWRQKLSLKVTFDDDIEAVAKRYLNGGQVFRHAGVSKVSIAIRYNLPGGKTKSLNITVTGWAGCNLRSVLDPVAQDIGYALLEHWGMMARLQPLSPDEQGHLMPLLIELYDHSNDDVTGKWLLDRGVAPRRLVEAGLLRRRERHDIILIDDDDQEVEIGPGAKLADVSLTTRHGEVLGPHDATEFEVYAIEREYLEELVVRQFRPLIKGIRPDRLDQNLLFLGLTECVGVRTPVYLARRLDSLEVLEKLNGLLWKRSGLGAGLVFCSGERVLSQIGSNIVMPVSEVLENDESAARLSIPAIANFHRTRRRATVSGLAVVLERYQHSAVLRIGEKATTLVGRQQITLIERLVRAHELDRPSVLTKELVDGMSISSPSQAFNRERWTSEIVGAFIEKVGKRDGWRLAVPIPSAVTSV